MVNKRPDKIGCYMGSLSTDDLLYLGNLLRRRRKILVALCRD